MKKLYLITGATGHVGTVLVPKLVERGEHVRVLVRPGQGRTLPDGIEIVYGDITAPESLRPFFEREGYDTVTLLHCAAFITIASGNNPRVWDTNVNGTRNVLELALSTGVDRVVYVSSVHAIPERPKPEVISEVNSFSPDLVHGQYAKSKAAAAQIALDYAAKGLNLSIVHPSGIIGPGDTELRNHMIRTVRAMAKGLIPVAMEGGYDFVDSRDIVEGILACEERGRPGECYILSGRYISVLEIINVVRRHVGKRETRIEVPHAVVRRLASVGEHVAAAFGQRAPIFTPYSVYTLHTNGFFSLEKAKRELGYEPRDIEESLRDSL